MQSRHTKYLMYPAFFALSLLTLLGHPDTARAQNLVASPTSINLSANVGSTTPQIKAVTISSTSSALSYTVSYSAPPYNWLSGDQTSGIASAGSNGVINVRLDPTGLAAGTYSGSITLTYQNPASNSYTIPVTFTILTASTLVASPTSLTFNAQVNGAIPLSQSLAISAPNQGLPFNAVVSPGAPWLSVNPGSALTGAATVPNIQVLVNQAGLAVGTYSGVISITSTASTPLVVPVVLNVTAQPVLTVSQSNLTFFYQLNTFPSDAQATIVLSTGSIAVPYSVTFTPSSCGNWITLSQTFGTTTANPNLTISAQTSNFTQPVTCAGVVSISAPATTNPTTNINVSLTVGTNSFLQVMPASVSFAYQAGGAVPQMQNLAISSSSGSQAYTVSTTYATAGASWLQVGPLTGNTLPASTVSLAVNPAGLNAGTYSATVNIVSAATANNASIPVTLTVSANSLLTVSPPLAYFAYQLGQALPTPEVVNVSSTGAPIPFVVTIPPTANTQFLTATASSTTTNATLTLTPNPGVLTPGTYTNSVVVTPVGVLTNPQTIPATLVVSANPLASISPSSLNFTYSAPTVPASQQLVIVSTNPASNIPFSISTSGEPWLIVTNTGLNGTAQATPASLTVQVAPQALTFGTYTSTILISAGGSVQPIPVTLTVNSGITLTPAPTMLSFSQQAGITTPVSLPLSIQTSTGTIGVTATASTVTGGSWLSVNPSTTTAPGKVTVTASAAGLAQGTYTGAITVSATGSASIVVPVTFTVTAPPALSAAPIGLTFTGTAGATGPALQNLQVTAAAATQFTPSATTAAGGNWLSVPTAALTTPATVPVSVNIAGLAVGTYNGTVTLTPAGGGTPLTVPVTLTLSQAPAPAYSQITNAASYLSGSIAPGEIVSLFGTNLGPTSPVSFALTAAGTVPTSLGGVTVTFNGISAPITYVSALQINCIVPFELAAAGTTSAQVVIAYNGVTSVAQSQPVVPAFPGLFTQNSGGTGAASILKPDYSTVSVTNAAPRGSTIIIYATGGGQTTPGSTTGAIAGSSLLLNSAPVTVSIGGLPATVSYAGSAPSLVTGVLQINAIVPPTANPGVQPVVIMINGVTSQSTATIAVQ